MNQTQAESAVTASALVVGGVYVFRRLSEKDITVTAGKGLRIKQLAGIGTPPPTGPFVVGWGFTFLVIALLAQASPTLGGSFALLVATGAVLANGTNVSKDVGKQLASDGAMSSASAGVGGPPKVSHPAPAQHVYPSSPLTNGGI